MSFAFSSPSRALITWVATCIVTFLVINTYATRPIPIHVEEFREAGMDDAQVLAEALQAARTARDNPWWINSAKPYLVFQSGRKYQIAPTFLSFSDLRITREGQTLVGRFTHVPAVATP
ncbi:MAG: hypothetical protein IAE99_01955 [Rhodothermales bacterium]|nr:hypothetical protein [Rhodothermales bacterium]